MKYEFVSGLADELHKLAQIPVEVEMRISRGAVREAAKVMRGAAMSFAPIGKGTSKWRPAPFHLRETIRVSTGVRGKIIKAAVRVGNRKKGVFYAGMVMIGTPAHIIKAPARGALGFGGIVRQVVQHPGAKAQPFMEQADQFARSAALDAAFNYADVKLAAYFKKLKSK